MYTLKSGEASGVRRSLASVDFAATIHKVAHEDKHYETAKHLIVLDEDDQGRGDLVLAEWFPETGWVTAVGVTVLADPLVRLLQVAEISDRIYGATSTIESGHLGADLAYLYAAIVKKLSVQFGRRNAEVLSLLRGEFPETHQVWTHIDIEEGAEKAEPRPMVRAAQGRDLVCPECGNDTFECEGEAHCSQVDVEGHLHRDGEVHVTYDWMSAGSADFEPGEVSCTNCGTVVCEPTGEIGTYEEEDDAKE